MRNRWLIALSAIHGRILTTWDCAGVAGPMLVSWFREYTQGYTTILLFFAGLFVVNLAVATVLKLHGKRGKETSIVMIDSFLSRSLNS